MRNLATVQFIEEIKHIDGADSIEAVRVLGWWCVTKKGDFQVGNQVCYIEIDSWVPTTLAPFLSKGKEPMVYEGISGERLRTVKLRGQLSQGLILPISVLPEGHYVEGQVVSEILGIVKYEPPISPQLDGLVRGNFPVFLRKTDQEQIQGCFRNIERLASDEWVVEEKLDGSSMTVAYNDHDLIVCSRNLNLKLEDENNTFVKTAMTSGILKALDAYGKNIALSGELIGEGIQGNRYAVKGHRWHVFDVFDILTQQYVDVDTRKQILSDLESLGWERHEVPETGRMTLEGQTVDSLLAKAEAKSVYNPKAEREGEVYKNIKNPEISFKAISNNYLLNGGE
jgi:RNA ligase (TIGR02306 family)